MSLELTKEDILRMFAETDREIKVTETYQRLKRYRKCLFVLADRGERRMFKRGCIHESYVISGSHF